MAHSQQSASQSRPIVRPMIRTPGTRQRLSVEKRFAIISLLEKGVPRREVMRQFSLKHSSNVTTILKRKDSIVRAMAKDTTARAKAIRSSKFPMIDKQLRDFVTHNNARGIRVSAPALTQAALRLARHYGVLSRFNASKAYMDKFLYSQNVIGEHGRHDDQFPLSGCTTITRSDYQESADEQSSSHSLSTQTIKTELQSCFLLKLRDFMKEHIEKVMHQVNKGMKQSEFMTEEEVVQLIEFKNDLLDHLYEFASSTITTLSQLINTDANRFIDLAENLMYRLITLSESLLIRLARLSRDIQLQALDLQADTDCDNESQEEEDHSSKIKSEEPPAAIIVE